MICTYHHVAVRVKNISSAKQLNIYHIHLVHGKKHKSKNKTKQYENVFFY